LTWKLGLLDVAQSPKTLREVVGLFDRREAANSLMTLDPQTLPLEWMHIKELLPYLHPRRHSRQVWRISIISILRNLLLRFPLKHYLPLQYAPMAMKTVLP
jgi:hypothetical protein